MKTRPAPGSLLQPGDASLPGGASPGRPDAGARAAGWIGPDSSLRPSKCLSYTFSVPTGVGLIYLKLATAVTIWGGNFHVTKALVSAYPALFVAVVRTVAGIFPLWIALWRRGDLRFPPPAARRALIVNIISGPVLNSGLYFIGLTFAPISNASLITALSPLVTSSLAALFLREPLPPRLRVALALGFFGALTVVTEGDWASLFSRRFHPGDLVFFAAVICGAVNNVSSRVALRHMSPTALAAWATTAGTLVLFPGAAWQLAGAVEAGALRASWWHLPLWFYGTVLAVSFSFVWWNQGLQAIGPGQTAIFSNGIPLAALLLAALVFGEPVKPAHWVALALIGSAVTLAFWQPDQRPRRTAAGA